MRRLALQAAEGNYETDDAHAELMEEMQDDMRDEMYDNEESSQTCEHETYDFEVTGCTELNSRNTENSADN
eukprot:SAG31_NODE_6622_length_1947_cov_3.100108_1_plen_71_part_00